MYCPNCDEFVTQRDRFCRACGAEQPTAPAPDITPTGDMPRKRPVGVWLICGYYAYGIVAWPVMWWLGGFSLAARMGMNSLDVLLSVAVAGLGWAAAWELFHLRAKAVDLFSYAFGLGLVALALSALNMAAANPQLANAASLIGIALGGTIIPGAIVWYVLRLHRQGVLT